MPNSSKSFVVIIQNRMHISPFNHRLKINIKREGREGGGGEGEGDLFSIPSINSFGTSLSNQLTLEGNSELNKISS